METTAEKRKKARDKFSWPVSVWVPDVNRFINCISLNVSKTGTLLKAPRTPLIQVGQEVEINWPRTKTLATEHGQYARIKRAKIVRIDPNSEFCNDSEIAIGVEFS